MIKLTDYKKSDILVIVIRGECQTHSAYAIDDTRYINKINYDTVKLLRNKRENETGIPVFV